MPTVEQKIAALDTLNQKIGTGGGQERIAKQHQAGKFTARERLNLLLDPDSFTEIDKFVTHRCTYFGMDKVEAPAEGVVTGYGTIEGRLVFIYAQDFTVLGGSLGEMHAQKICKVMDLARKTGAPIIGLHDSGGARIQEGIDALSGYGQIFFRNTLASGVIPQIAVILGPSAGGAVYSPALMDFVFMVEGISQMFITGPQVIKAVTGEEVTSEQLGGALTHNQISGNAHFFARNEQDCFTLLKQLLSYLPGNNMEDPPQKPTNDDPGRVSPELDALMPEEANRPYDVKQLIASIVDDQIFLESQAYFAPNIVTAFARMGGRSVGIIANQPNFLAGCLDYDASDKAARFIRFCDAFNLPLLNIVDVPGFLPGTAQEYGGIIRHGAKMLYAYSEATVPKITLITRKAYGGAYLAMCSRDLGADQVLAWPSAEIAVMGPEGAANIIFKKEIEQSPDPQTTREEKITAYREQFANPYLAAQRGYVDLIIPPRETRPRIINSLNMLQSKREERPAKKHGNIPL